MHLHPRADMFLHNFMRKIGCKNDVQRYYDDFKAYQCKQRNENSFENVTLTFSFPESVSKKSTTGWLYSINEVTVLGSVWSLPQLVRSMEVALCPFFLRRSTTLYQHHAPNPPPWMSTKCLGSDPPIVPGGSTGECLNSKKIIDSQF